MQLDPGTLLQWQEQQEQLRTAVIQQDAYDLSSINLIGGMDISFAERLCCTWPT